MDNAKLQRLVSAVQASVNDDPRKPQYRGAENCLGGHCYVASEALYHLLGGERSGWMPHSVQHEGGPHWYLKHRVSGVVVDPSEGQHDGPIPHEQGRPRTFATQQPSKQAQAVLDRVRNDGSTPMVKGELEKVVLDPSLGYKISHQDLEPDYASGRAKPKPRLHVAAHDATGKQVGYAHFEHDGRTRLHPVFVQVENEHRRKGIASAMYAHAERVSGRVVHRSNDQTTSGKALWQGNRSLKQFGKSESLEKMTISSIPMGARNPYGAEEWDYSHVLPSEQKDAVKSLKVRRVNHDVWQSYMLGPTGTQLGSVNVRFDPRKKSIGVEESILNPDHRGKGLGMAMYEAAYAHAMHHLKAKHVVGGEHSTSASATHQRLAQKHGLGYTASPNPNPQQADPGDFDGHFGEYKYALKSELEKSRPNPTFPKLGVPDDRRETMVVGSESVGTKIRQIANAAGRAGKAKTYANPQERADRFSKIYGSAHGTSESNGPTINSYAVNDAARKNPSPKDVVTTAMHEDLHNIFKRVHMRYGDLGKKNLANNLLNAALQNDPEFHAAAHDFVNVRNGADFLKRTTIPSEEVLAHLTAYVNNPRERERYHTRKKNTPEAARAFDNVMKRGHKLIVQMSRTADPMWVLDGYVKGGGLHKAESKASMPKMPSHHCQAFVQSDGIIRQCKKPVKASGLCYLHLEKVGRMFGKDVEKPQLVVASVAVFNSEGYLLMGQRNDSGKWTIPGGKADSGEKPEDCAHRELWEEAGLKIKKLEYLGAGWGGKNGDVRVHSYRGVTDDSPNSENDPDKEVDEWEWIDVREGLPEEIKGKLHNGDNDITLQILGLQEGGKSVELSKSWKHAFVGAMTAATMSQAAMAQDGITEDHQQPWTPAGLVEGLKPIAQLESGSGQNVNHTPHSKGEYHTAHGAVGLKVVTAHEEYKRNKYLQQIWPDLHDQQKFTDAFKSSPALYNAAATAHWNRLKKIFGGDRKRAAYAWRWGQTRASTAAPEIIDADPYVKAYKKIWDRMQMQRVASVLKNPLEKTEQWLAQERHPAQRLVLYDFAEDPHGYLHPTAKHTEYGTFYEPTEIESAIEKLKRLGYHGYTGHDPQDTGHVLFPEYKHLASVATPTGSQ